MTRLILFFYHQAFCHTLVCIIKERDVVVSFKISNLESNHPLFIWIGLVSNHLNVFVCSPLPNCSSYFTKCNLRVCTSISFLEQRILKVCFNQIVIIRKFVDSLQFTLGVIKDVNHFTVICLMVYYVFVSILISAFASTHCGYFRPEEILASLLYFHDIARS